MSLAVMARLCMCSLPQLSFQDLKLLFLPSLPTSEIEIANKGVCGGGGRKKAPSRHFHSERKHRE